MLNFGSKFIPDYKRIAAPLNTLMGAKAKGKWEEEHTEALNLLGSMIWRRLKLSLVDMNVDIDLHVDTDGEHCSVLMS